MKWKSVKGLRKFVVFMLSLVLVIGLIPVSAFASETIPFAVKVVVYDGDENVENDVPIEKAKVIIGLKQGEIIEEIISGETDKDGLFSGDIEQDKIAQGYTIKVEHESYEILEKEYEAIEGVIERLEVTEGLKIKIAPEENGSDQTEPESTEPESTEPESTEPESTEPESTEPESAEPESTEPESTEPESTEPESTEPESTEPESTESESAEDPIVPLNTGENAEKADGSGSVTMENWVYGDTAPSPVPTSTTNGINHVEYVYKEKSADDSAYTSEVPTKVGEYTVKATFAATSEYTEAVATTDFSITERTLTIVHATATGREYIENDKMVDITELTVGNIYGNDGIKVTGYTKGTLSSDAAGTYSALSIDVSELKLEGIDAGNYKLPDSAENVPTDVTITPKSSEEDKPQEPSEPEEHKHSWSSTWTWNETHHWKGCEGAVLTKAACTEVSEYAEHTWIEDAEKSTDTVKAYKCQLEGCGAVKTEKMNVPETEETDPPHEHTFNIWAYDNDNHWLICVCDADVIEGKESHAWIRVPEKDTDTKYAYSCECGAEGVSSKPTESEYETKESVKETVKETKKPNTDSPSTGDDTNVKAGMAVAILSLAIMGGMLFKYRKKNHK